MSPLDGYPPKSPDQPLARLPWAPSPADGPRPVSSLDRPGGAGGGDVLAPPRPRPPGPVARADHGDVLDLDEIANGNGPRGALETRDVSCWFGSNKVLERVSLVMKPRQVTALIGPSGCGKSTYLRTLNRMHELVPSARMSGQVLLDGEDIYGQGVRVTDTRLRIGMVFQKPNEA
jgi:phosphate transport system ATP-binding protein